MPPILLLLLFHGFSADNLLLSSRESRVRPPATECPHGVETLNHDNGLTAEYLYNKCNEANSIDFSLPNSTDWIMAATGIIKASVVVLIMITTAFVSYQNIYGNHLQFNVFQRRSSDGN